MSSESKSTERAKIELDQSRMNPRLTQERTLSYASKYVANLGISPLEFATNLWHKMWEECGDLPYVPGPLAVNQAERLQYSNDGETLEITMSNMALALGAYMHKDQYGQLVGPDEHTVQNDNMVAEMFEYTFGPIPSFSAVYSGRSVGKGQGTSGAGGGTREGAAAGPVVVSPRQADGQSIPKQPKHPAPSGQAPDLTMAWYKLNYEVGAGPTPGLPRGVASELSETQLANQRMIATRGPPPSPRTARRPRRSSPRSD